MKVLSFIIPLYNSSQWLRKCLDSVLKQDIPLEQMEVICVNDGSPDNSADIACEYGKKYPNTILVLNQENQGPAGARNNGIRHAKGKYLCFFDPDDHCCFAERTSIVTLTSYLPSSVCTCMIADPS